MTCLRWKACPRAAPGESLTMTAQKDKLGTLNLLTPDVVQSAAAEIKEGVSISLK